MLSFFSKFASAKWLQNAAKIKYVACPNQQIGLTVAKINSADLKRIGVSLLSSSNETDSSGEKHVNGGTDKERILPTFNSSITALGLFRSLFKRGPKETLLAFVENEDAKWSRAEGCRFTESDRDTIQECRKNLSREGTNGGGGGPSNGKADGGATQPSTVAGDEGRNGAGATGGGGGAGEGGILEKVVEKLHDIFAGQVMEEF